MPWRSSGLGKGGATTLISLAKETTPQLIVRKFPYKNSKPVSLVSDIKVVAPPLPRPGNHAFSWFLIHSSCHCDLQGNITFDPQTCWIGNDSKVLNKEFEMG